MDEPEKKSQVINEATMVSLSLVLVLIGTIAGGVFYIATALNKEEIIQSRLSALEAKQETYNNTMLTVSDRLARIEGYMRAQGEKRK